VREYSAPDGVHPQPEMSRILEELGFVAYYYTGDGGSAPNRSFYDGRMLSESLVAFPVVTLGPVASVGEMLVAPGMTPARAAAWLTEVADYCERNRTVRLVYTHPYDFASTAGGHAYAEVWRRWFDDLAERQAAGRFQVRPMSEYADFLLRVATTEARFIREGNGLRVQLSHPDGLRHLAFAVPHGAYTPTDTTGLRAERDGDDDVWILTGDGATREIVLVAR
jgi:hypothetical protein